MSDQKDPSKPMPNDEKFKPQNVKDESSGSVTGNGRPDRTMDRDTARGSEPDTRGASQNRNG